MATSLFRCSVSAAHNLNAASAVQVQSTMPKRRRHTSLAGGARVAVAASPGATAHDAGRQACAAHHTPRQRCRLPPLAAPQSPQIHTDGAQMCLSPTGAYYQFPRQNSMACDQMGRTQERTLTRAHLTLGGRLGQSRADPMAPRLVFQHATNTNLTPCAVSSVSSVLIAMPGAGLPSVCADPWPCCHT